MSLTSLISPEFASWMPFNVATRWKSTKRPQKVLTTFSVPSVRIVCPPVHSVGRWMFDVECSMFCKPCLSPCSLSWFDVRCSMLNVRCSASLVCPLVAPSKLPPTLELSNFSTLELLWPPVALSRHHPERPSRLRPTTFLRKRKSLQPFLQAAQRCPRQNCRLSRLIRKRALLGLSKNDN